MSEVDQAQSDKPNHSLVTLRIFGDELDPAPVSKLMVCAPTRCHRKGELITNKDGKPYWNEHTQRYSTRKTGLWSVEAQRHEPADLEAQINEILDRLTADLGDWESLAKTCKVDLFVGWFMARSNEMFELSEGTLTALSSRRIGLVFDIYDPS
jgi:hypothetical protein